MEEHKGRCEDNLNLFPCQLCQCGPLHLAFPGDVADACTNIEQVVVEEEEEEEGGNLHVHTWRNASVRVDFFGGLH